jgi:hypothetical protein
MPTNADHDRQTYVDDCRSNVHDLLGSTHYHTESLVQLEQGDVLLFEAGCFQSLGDSESRSGWEVDRSGSRVGISCMKM